VSYALGAWCLVVLTRLYGSATIPMLTADVSRGSDTSAVASQKSTGAR